MEAFILEEHTEEDRQDEVKERDRPSLSFIRKPLDFL